MEQSAGDIRRRIYSGKLISCGREEYLSQTRRELVRIIARGHNEVAAQIAYCEVMRLDEMFKVGEI